MRRLLSTPVCRSALTQRSGLFAVPPSSIGSRTVLVRRYGIVDEIKKNIEEDEQLKEAREALKKEQEDEYDRPEYHEEGTQFSLWKDYFMKVYKARNVVMADYEYLRDVRSQQFEQDWARAKKDRADISDLEVRVKEDAARQRFEEEKQRVKEGRRQKDGRTKEDIEKVQEQAEKHKSFKEYVESWRPENYLTKMEQEKLELERKKEERRLQREKDTALYEKYLKNLEKIKQAKMDGTYEEDIMDDDEEVLGGKKKEKKEGEENPFPYAPESTALVAGPDKTGWAKLKENIGFNPKNTKLYQKGLEFKERLEDSENVVVGKTMDTLGAMGDLSRAGYNKVTGESETAASLRQIKEVWPDFDTNQFWLETVRSLPRVVRAFHERDFEWIKENGVPQMYDILCHKSEELVKSSIDPARQFFPFIMSYPKSGEILKATVDDPQQPYILMKFSLQKTAEKPPKEDFEDPDFDNNPKAVDFGNSKLFEGMEVTEEIQKNDYGDLPPPGFGISPEFHTFALSKRQKRFVKRRTEDKLDFLQNVKIVRADYVMVLQYTPEVKRWLVSDFHEARMDLSF